MTSNKRSDSVPSLPQLISTVKIQNDAVVVDTMHRFSRIMCTVEPKDLEDHFKYELSPQPLALFEGNVLMRKGKKSTLYEIFEPLLLSDSTVVYDATVIDGGHLLHKVVWLVTTTNNHLMPYIQDTS